MKYYSIAEVSKMLNVTSQTLRNWDKSGKLTPSHKSCSGYRYYSQEQVNRILGIKDVERKVVGYCRVNSDKQKDDLDKQVQNMQTYLMAKGRPFEIIEEIGDGIDCKKAGLESLIKQITANEVDKVVILYKDRLIRFGYELIAYICSLYNCDIEIIDNSNKIEQEDLLEDMKEVMKIFSSNLQGEKASKTKEILNQLEKD
ncbi:MAG: IS607 family transposase [Peptostreptococcaceae bacterium]